MFMPYVMFISDTEEASETDIPHNDEPLEVKEQYVVLTHFILFN